MRAHAYRTNIGGADALPAAARLRKWLLAGSCPGQLDLEECLRAFSAAAQGGGNPRKASRWMTSGRFRRLTELIEENLGSGLTVARLGREIGVSASFLSRAFSAFCGQTPYDFILTRRVQRARRLIATTDCPLPEIALQAGFSSQSHMTASMKARLGLRPSTITRPRQIRRPVAGGRPV
ncbi:helix-turn-helix transcriptional regulator [Roseibium salinum]|nr:helix-turn-helix transcriptional regulator [Roseibium salinum]